MENCPWENKKMEIETDSHAFMDAILKGGIIIARC